MKASPKEILNNKSNKMVDLILDEIRNGGAKTITAGFTDKNDKQYILTVGISVSNPDEDIDMENVCAFCSCNSNLIPDNIPTDLNDD